MLSDDGDPLGLWLYAERYLGVGTRAYSSFSPDLDISDAYHPQRGAPSFPLATFWVPDAAGEYLRGPIGSGLHALYRRVGEFLLPVHPDTLASPDLPGRDVLDRCAPGPVIEVVPTANARTAFVLSVDGSSAPPHFVKLHFPRRSSRFTRRLRRPIIGVQLWVSGELVRIGAPFLPEVGAGVLGTEPRLAWGYLLREPSAFGGRSLECTVPLFALYGTDARAPGDPTLLEQLVARSGEPPLRFLADRVIRPMVRLWLTTALATGCNLELHGQNTLFTFDRRPGDGGLVSRILYRDCGVYVDPQIRTAGGAPAGLPEINVISRDVAHPREQVFSLAYDSFMGHHVFSFLARLAAERLGVAEEPLQDAARSEFASVPGSGGLLPPTVYYYDDQLHPDGGWKLVDTGAVPVWRPPD